MMTMEQTLKEAEALNKCVAEDHPSNVQVLAVVGYCDDFIQEIRRLRETLEFYADPENYHAILILPDRPSGAFADDFSDDHGHPDYNRPMPGKTARDALARVIEQEVLNEIDREKYHRFLDERRKT